LDILEERGFNVDKYKNISINETAILNDTDQLDMLVENPAKKQIYVKYYVTKALKPKNVNDIVDDLFHIENKLNKANNDDLIIIVKDEPNETLLQTIKDIWI
jgi:uncharacterized protein YjcR